MGKLRRAAKSSVGVVKHLLRRFDDCVNHRGGHLPAAPRRKPRPRDRALDHLCLLQHLAGFVAIGLSNRKQHTLETGPPIRVRWRKISPPIKRLAVRSKKGRERPPTLSGERAHRRLIPAVNIRTLIPVHFHRYVMLVDDRRHFGIVIRLAIHHVTPVAPNRPNIQEHRLVSEPSSRKRLLPKFVPSDRLVHRPPQIKRRNPSPSVV